MNLNKKSIIIPIIILSLFMLFTNGNSRDLIYLNDSIYSLVVNIKNRFDSPKKNITIVNPQIYKKYTRTYSNLPYGFTQAGFLLFYKSKNKIKLSRLGIKIIKLTYFYKESRLINAIKKFNGIKKGYIEKNRVILIPGSLPSLTLDIVGNKKSTKIFTRGLYYSGSTIGRVDMLKKIPTLRKAGINTIVFDAKDVTGIVNYNSHVKYTEIYKTDRKKTIDNIRLLLITLKKHKIYSIARIAVFHDRLLYKKNPEFRIKSKRTGRSWRAGRELWLDPTNKKVQDYNIQLAIELAEMGVDEIQFDYIRFPTSGNLSDAKYKYDFGKMNKENTIAGFLKRAYKEISSRNCKLSIDIFGVVAWGKSVDIKKTGQKIELLYKYCDIISPMLYPSHFDDNFINEADPQTNPYYFVFEGIKKVKNLSKNRVIVRPWLQAFKWRVRNYNTDYILKQIKATNDSGGYGYLFWNASNRYGLVFESLKKLKSVK